MLRLAFTSFIALSGMKRTFTLLIFFTVHSFSVSPDAPGRLEGFGAFA